MDEKFFEQFFTWAKQNQNATHGDIFKAFPQLNNDTARLEKVVDFVYDWKSGSKIEDVYEKYQEFKPAPKPKKGYLGNLQRELLGVKQTDNVSAPVQNSQDYNKSQMEGTEIVAVPKVYKWAEKIPTDHVIVPKKNKAQEAAFQMQQDRVYQQAGVTPEKKPTYEEFKEAVEKRNSEEARVTSLKNQAEAEIFYKTPQGKMYYNVLQPMYRSLVKAGRSTVGTAVGMIDRSAADAIVDYFDFDKRGSKDSDDASLYTKPANLQGNLFNDGKIKWSVAVPKTVETLTTMATLLGGGRGIGALGGSTKTANAAGLVANSYLITREDYRDQGKAAGLKGDQLETFSDISAGLTSMLELISPNDVALGTVKKAITKEILKDITKGVAVNTAFKRGLSTLGKEILGENAQELLQGAGDHLVKLGHDKLNNPDFNEDLSWKGLKDEVLETIVLTTISTGLLTTPSTAKNYNPSVQEKSAWYTAAKNSEQFEQALDKAVQTNDISAEQAEQMKKNLQGYSKEVERVEKAGFSGDQAMRMAWAAYKGNKLSEHAAVVENSPALKAALKDDIKQDHEEILNEIKSAGMGVPEVGSEIAGSELATIQNAIGNKGNDVDTKLINKIKDNEYRVEEVPVSELVENDYKLNNEDQLKELQKEKPTKDASLVPPVVSIDGKIVDGRKRIASAAKEGKKTVKVFKQIESDAKNSIEINQKNDSKSTPSGIESTESTEIIPDQADTTITLTENAAVPAESAPVVGLGQSGDRYFITTMFEASDTDSREEKAQRFKQEVQLTPEEKKELRQIEADEELDGKSNSTLVRRAELTNKIVDRVGLSGRVKVGGLTATKTSNSGENVSAARSQNSDVHESRTGNKSEQREEYYNKEIRPRVEPFEKLLSLYDKIRKSGAKSFKEYAKNNEDAYDEFAATGITNVTKWAESDLQDKFLSLSDDLPQVIGQTIGQKKKSLWESGERFNPEMAKEPAIDSGMKETPVEQTAAAEIKPEASIPSYTPEQIEKAQFARKNTYRFYKERYPDESVDDYNNVRAESEKIVKQLADELKTQLNQGLPYTGDTIGSQRVSFEDLGFTGNESVEDAINKLIAYGGEFTPILEFIKRDPNLKNISLELHNNQGGKFNGLYHPKGVGLPKSVEGLLEVWNKENTYYTTVHELLHFYTLDGGTDFKQAKDYELLEDIFHFIKQAKGKREEITDTNYGLVNFKEFMAELLINPTFRDYISDVYAKSRTEFIKKGKYEGREIERSFIDVLLDFLRDLFAKAFGKSPYASELNLDESLIDNAVNIAEKLFFGGKYVRATEPMAENIATERVYEMDESSAAALPSGSSKTAIEFARTKMMQGVSEDVIKQAVINGAGVSEDVAQNIIENAKNYNIFRPLPGQPGTGLTQSIDPEAALQVVANLNTSFWEKTKAAAKKFKNKYFSKDLGLPNWVTQIKDFAQGRRDADIRHAHQLVNKLKRAMKAEKFTDANLVDEALRSQKQPGPSKKINSQINRNLLPQGEVLSVVAPADTALMKLPVKVREVVIQMREALDGLSRDLVVGGFVKPDQAITIEENLGEYLHRAYKIHNDKSWVKNIPEKVKIEAARYLVQEAYSKIKATDPSISDLDAIRQAKEVAEGRIRSIIEGTDEVHGIRTKEGRKDVGVLKQRSEIPKAIREFLGEYTDPGITFSLTIAKMAALKANGELLTQLRRQGLGSLFYEENDPRRPPEYSQQFAGAGSEVWSPLNGLFTTPEIKEAFEQSSKDLGKIWRAYQNIVGAIRWGKTVLSPITQIKNFESNLFFAIMNGHWRVGKFKDSWKFFKSILANRDNAGSSEQIVDKLTRLNVVNQSVGAQELRKMLRDDRLGELVIGLKDDKTIFSRLRDVYNYLNKVYSGSDSFWKMYGFLNEAQSAAQAFYKKDYKDLSTEESKKIDEFAAERIKNTYPTYSRVWKGAKTLSENVPLFGNFLSFQAESLRVFGNSIEYAVKDIKSGDPALKKLGAQRIGGIVAYLGGRTAFLYGIGQLAGIGLSGLLRWTNDDDEDEKRDDINRFVPSFIRSGDKLVTTKKNGLLEVYDLSSIDPYGAIFRPLNALSEGSDKVEDPGITAALYELVSPFVEEEMLFESILEARENKDAYGRQIYNPDDMSGEKLSKILLHVVDKMKPSAIGFAQRVYERDDKKKELMALAGLRGYDVDPLKGMVFKFRDQAPVLIDVFKDFYTAAYKAETDEQKEKVLQQNEARIKKIINKLHEDYKAALRLGADPAKLDEIIFGGEDPGTGKRVGGLKSQNGYRNAVKDAIKSGEMPEEGFLQLPE